MKNSELFSNVYAWSYANLEENLLKLKNLRFDPDIGHSILRKNLIKFSIGKHIS